MLQTAFRVALPQKMVLATFHQEILIFRGWGAQLDFSL